MRKNSIKNIRINAEVQRELSRIIQQEIKDPRIHPMTTVVMAEVTPDLKYCKAYISVLGNEEAQKHNGRFEKSLISEALYHSNLNACIIFCVSTKHIRTYFCVRPVHRVWCSYDGSD